MRKNIAARSKNGLVAAALRTKVWHEVPIVKTITVAQLLNILKGVDPSKVVKLNVLLEDHPTKSHLEIGLTNSVKIENDCIWLSSFPEHSAGLYAANGYETIPPD